ncbi:Tol-Pal system beta propeller repeat protein TolB [Rickettsiales endosymbiont of Peranema trichophorum]|uniref:Tol-Pal system beta propeller repeat protein TolB n=1 Tax=Rickettsiales endosymbiont of Peranema trichophorum TaxID=2486577 RepID=UPI001A91601E
MVRYFAQLSCTAVFLYSVIASSVSFALVQIDITQGNVEPVPIAIDAFTGNNNKTKELGHQITEVIASNLQNSGLFRSVSKIAFLEETGFDKTPVFANWRKLNATALIVGVVEEVSHDNIVVHFKMWDVFSEVLVEDTRYQTSYKAWRRIAHKISDKIYSRTTGETGYFDTRVVFISEDGPPKKRVKRLAVMDQDGENVKFLTNGKYLVLTPRFDMKNHKIIYMSYQNLVPKVYTLDIHTGVQKLIGHFPGMSFAPRFSPDGHYAVMSVAKHGATNLYQVDLRSGVMTQLTYDRAIINTSPSYSPDGSRIVFNSDRGGSRQLYVMNRDGSDVKRISFGTGVYATPVWSPRGDYIAFTKFDAQAFYIGIMRTDGSGERLLTTSWLDEGPTWSPNGRVIMFTRRRMDGHSNLYAIDITGYHERLIRTPQDASDPAWSHLLQ